MSSMKLQTQNQEPKPEVLLDLQTSAEVVSLISEKQLETNRLLVSQGALLLSLSD